MGNRALIQFKVRDEVSPVIYLHWHGDAVRKLLDKTRNKMEDRPEDVAYTAARFIGICHEMIGGNLSLGVWNQGIELADSGSHGDASIFVVDLTDWSVRTGGGYGFRNEC